MNEAGGIHAESFIDVDSQGADGQTSLALSSSIVASNDGVGFGGAAPGTSGQIVGGGGGDNFVVNMTYNDLYGNAAGEFDSSWIVDPGNNIEEDPLLTPLTYIPERCSPTIDTGDPSLAFDEEPSPNGDRVNMGSTANTSNAPTSLADVSGDGVVDGVDIVRLSVAFGSTDPQPRYNTAVDVNADSWVDGDDLALLIADFVRICP
jgi:hypothetical protein